MRKIKVSIIIPNWNGRFLLEDCLRSLLKQSFKDFEVVVVDNGSTDSSSEYIHSNFPHVRTVNLDKNYGFAKAVNEGVKASNAEYVVFLNNDTSVDKIWLKNLVECANNHPEVISVNSKLLNFYDKKIIDGVGISVNEVGQAKSIGWQERNSRQYSKENYIFGATGGASLFRRKDFIKVGFLDENFFMYSEEVDFAFRAQFLGYRSIFCPTAIIFHKHKATSRNYPNHIEYWQFRNMTQTIIKDFPTSVLLKKWRWLKIILIHINTIFYQLRNGYWWSPFLADLWILFHILHLLRERKKIQSSIKVDITYIDSFFKEKKINFFGFKW